MGKIYGRIRIQKLLYLLKRLGVQELEGVPFSYHHYGPFSSIVAEGLSDCVRAGAIIEHAATLEDARQRYEYTLGNSEASARSLSPQSIALAKKLVDRVRGDHWRTLELASTIDFLEQTQRLPREQACACALELKPECKDFRQQALDLLHDLELPSVLPPPHQQALTATI
jgi:uncharacterized protein YwgA